MKTEPGWWTVTFRDESAPTEERGFATEREAKQAAQTFATTKRKRAYVSDPDGQCIGCQHDDKWYWG